MGRVGNRVPQGLAQIITEPKGRPVREYRVSNPHSGLDMDVLLDEDEAKRIGAVPTPAVAPTTKARAASTVKNK